MVVKTKKAVQQDSDDEESSEPAVKAKKVASPKQTVAKKPVKHVEPESDEDEDEPVKPAKGKKAQPAPEKMEEEDEEGVFEIIVKGLSFKAYENDISELFSECDNIQEIKLLQKDGRSKGIAFIKFSMKSSFNSALEYNGTEHMGRTLVVEEAQGRQDNNKGGFNNRQNNRQNNFQGGQKRQFQQQGGGDANIETPTLFIGGLSFNSTNDSVRDFFSSVGEVASARVVTDKETGKVHKMLFSPEGLGMWNSTMLRLLSRHTSR